MTRLKGAKFGAPSADTVDTNAIGRGIIADVNTLYPFLSEKNMNKEALLCAGNAPLLWRYLCCKVPRLVPFILGVMEIVRAFAIGF